MAATPTLRDSWGTNAEFTDEYTCQKSSFIKVKSRRDPIRRGLGHSQTNLNNFDRRNYFTTHSTVTESGNYASTQPLTTKIQITPCPHNQRLQFTEQRCNYESLVQNKLDLYSRTRYVLKSQPCHASLTSSVVETIGDKVQTMISDIISAEFLALREFRLSNRNECFGQIEPIREQRYHTSFNKEASDDYSTPQLQKHLSSTPKPYVLQQSLLRGEMNKDVQNRRTQLDYLAKGLNKSCALSFQATH